ncbi:hypothetical protein KPL71_008367 [Citrus sinensis]|uniref:Uncharacterized protein n=1 Tax=Citrus sinensis TaxID=2711 RepID=A0ACB8M6M7_CITSI|nr:hypothetical protein KPL71_008367 [Citrus sinensis]
MTGHSKSNSNDDGEVESVQVPTEKTNTKRKNPTQRRPMKKRSETWNHYTVLEDNQYKAKCNYCGKIYQCHPRFDGISNMGTHLKVYETYLNVKQEQDERQQKLAAESGEGNAITVDNASGNDVAIDYVKNQMLMWKNVDALVLRGDYMHVRCCAHILNLIVTRGLKELHDSVVGIRNAVKWNSVYLMLMTALKFREAFKRMAEVDKPYEAYFREEENGKKRWGHLSLKIGNMPKEFAKIEEMVAVMKGLLISLFDAYSGWNSSPPLPSEIFRSGSASGGGSGSSSSPHLIDDMDRQQGYIMEHSDDTLRVARPFLGYAKKVLIQNEGKLVTTEVERYLLDPIEDPSNDKLNVLLWWKVNGSKYSILQKIPRDILAIPVSTMASESTFSIGGRIIGEYRSSLTPTMIETLICTENWLQSKLFATSIYDLNQELKDYIYQMELQEGKLKLVAGKQKLRTHQSVL